jgi:hypothetical protein
MASTIKRSTAQQAGNIATILIGIVIILQLLIAAGVVPVNMAWGGQFDELTAPLRFASLAAIVILALFAYLIRRRAGLAGQWPPSTAIRVLSWIVTAYFALNLLMNMLSPSLVEKLLFGSITLLLVSCCLIVSLSDNGQAAN